MPKTSNKKPAKSPQKRTIRRARQNAKLLAGGKPEKALRRDSGQAPTKKERYFEAIGRRKTAIARIKLFTSGQKEFLVNNKPYHDYFPTLALRQIAIVPLEKMQLTGNFRILVKVKGGGLHAQAEAVRHGISRALVLLNASFRKQLKAAGFLTRDARMRERKKFGLKRARRAPQWQKR